MTRTIPNRCEGNKVEEEKQQPVQARDEGQTPIHEAAARGDMHELEELLKDYVPGESANIIDVEIIMDGLLCMKQLGGGDLMP